MYTFRLLFEYRDTYGTVHPNIRDIDDYVRKLRENGERFAGQRAAEPEKHVRMAGAEFATAILTTKIEEGTYFQGVACTERKPYLLCFKAEAPTIDAVRALLALDHKLAFFAPNE